MTIQSSPDTVDTGLYGVPICKSGISTSIIDPNGNPLVLYRGYSIYDLVRGSFEESLYLILYGELPKKAELDNFKDTLYKESRLNDEIVRFIEFFPKSANKMDFLLSALSFARLFDKDYNNSSWLKTRSNQAEAVKLLTDCGLRLGAKIPAIIGYGSRIFKGLEPIPPQKGFSYAKNLLYMMGLETDEDSVAALNASLILYLDHTITNSTFITRVAESARGDPYGPFLAAAVGLKGVLHGGANELAADMLAEIGEPENVEKFVTDHISNGDVIFGFGHRFPVYKKSLESRVVAAIAVMRPLLEKKGMSRELKLFDALVGFMESEKVEERKRRAPNLDLPTCLIYKAIGIDKDWNTPVFQASRHFGWVAHAAEQRNNGVPLYRPTQINAENTAAPKKYIPLNQR
ncbi:MAG: citrate synthase [Myxococcota bacterium]